MPYTPDVPFDTEPTEAEASRAQSPMEIAKAYIELTRYKRQIDVELKRTNEGLAALQDRILALIENEELPASFKALKASVYTREEIWASAKEGDHGRLTAALRATGLTEYLPSKVNSQSISAYVREHYDKETGEFDLDPRLLEALNISIKPKVVVNG